MDIVMSLIGDHKVPPSCTDNGGNTALHLACMSGHLSTIEYLVDNQHCDTDAGNGAGETPRGIVNKENYLYRDVVSYMKEAKITMTTGMCVECCILTR